MRIIHDKVISRWLFCPASRQSGQRRRYYTSAPMPPESIVCASFKFTLCTGRSTTPSSSTNTRAVESW